MINRGILIFAHNNELIDYIKIASVSAKFASKNLNLPVTLITDSISVNSTSITDLKKYFDDIKLVDQPESSNKRIINKTYCSFLNINRNTAWDLTPYDQTLVIDADYFIFTDKLNQYWDIDQSFMIAEGVDYFDNDVLGPRDIHVSESTIPMRWATSLMFKKNKESKLLFDLVSFIKGNQDYYSNLYKFDKRMYRNDISFSIACHIMDGHLNLETYKLPKIKTIRSTGKILKIKNDSHVKFVLLESDSLVLESKNSDVHFLNKIDLLDHIEDFL